MTLVLCLGALLIGAGAGLAVGRGGAVRAAAERDAVRAERDRLHAERVAGEDRVRAAEVEAAGLRASLVAERSAVAEKAAAAERAEARLREAFQALSAEALRQNTDAFVALAESRLKQATTEASGDLARRQQAIEGIVGPLRETLGKVESQIQAVEKDRAGAYHALLQQVGTMRQTSEQLRLETAQLVTALRAPQVRGRWGEMQLRRVVESAGMVEHCDFEEQETSSTDDGVLRPDLVVRLSGGKHVVVDAKVSFIGYLEAMEARDEARRSARLKAHARHLRDHVDRLADKAYWQRFDPSPEFAVCFVPADAFLNAALEQEPALLEYAFERNVVIATPSTLIALLRTIAYTWRQEALAKNARQVHTLARVLYTRLASLGGHISGVGDALNRAVKKYNEAVGSMESRVLVTARQLSELKVVDEELGNLRQVESLARSVQAPVLVSGDSIVPMPSGAKASKQPKATGIGQRAISWTTARRPAVDRRTDECGNMARLRHVYRLHAGRWEGTVNYGLESGPDRMLTARRGRWFTGPRAVLLLVAVALAGGAVDLVTGTGLRLGFAIGLTLGSLLAAMLVQRHGLLAVAFAPPLVFLAASLVFVLAVPRQAGGNGRLIDAATGWLVYGFPTMATATGVAVVTAGIRVARGTSL